MRTYIIKRLIQAVGVCLVISMISFFLLFLNTDPALLLLPPEAEMKDIANFKKQMGLDRPILVQYGDFLQKVVFHGDFGQSFVAKVPAGLIVRNGFRPPLKLAVAALILVNLVAIPVGIIAAIRRYSLMDNVATFTALVGQAMPLYWFGIMLIIIFGVWLRWLPISGSDTLAHLVLPAVTLGSWILPDQYASGPVRDARRSEPGLHPHGPGKGTDGAQSFDQTCLQKRRHSRDHDPGNADGCPPGRGGGNRNGICLAGNGPTGRGFNPDGDYPVVQAVVVVFAFFVIIGNLAADILAALIDPRIRLE